MAKPRPTLGLKPENHKNRPIQMLRGDYEYFKKANIILFEGQPAVELDKKRLKVGDGVTKYNDLEYIGAGDSNLSPEIYDIISKFTEDGDGELLFDGKSIGASYTDTNGCVSSVGGFAVGDTADNMSFQDFAYKLLHPYTKPVVNVRVSPNVYMYDKMTDSISSIEIIADVTKKSNDITSIKFYVGNTLLKTITENVSRGGVFSCTYSPADPINTTTTFKVVVNDEANNTIANKTITFVAKSYYGLAEEIDVIDANFIVNNLTSVLKKEIKLEYVFTANNQKVVYATPIGTLKSIVDGNGFDYINDFDHTTIVINGITYNVYVKTDPANVEDFKFTFS